MYQDIEPLQHKWKCEEYINEIAQESTSLNMESSSAQT